MTLRWRLRPRVWVALGFTLVLMASLFRVEVTGPPVAVRWTPDTRDADRLAREDRYGLRAGRHESGTTWEYELGDWSDANVEALVEDSAVADTSGIDRTTLTAPSPDIDVDLRPLPFPLSENRQFPDVLDLFQVQSLCALLAGAGLFWAAGIDDPRRRRLAAAGMLALFGAAAYALPISPSMVHMGDADTYTASRGAFENYSGVQRIRYEAHLSHAILGRLYSALGTTADAPNEALNLLMRMATAWFLLCACAVAIVERWSPIVIRYLGLAVLAPASLLYFGYRELGHLSLNVAAFPLLARGLRSGSPRLEAAGALFGLGAAFHGFGILSLAGSCAAAAAVPAPLAHRVRLALRVAAWGVAAYVGWIGIYLIVLKLPVVAGHAEAVPWRPLLVDELSAVHGNRINPAILSAAGARDVLLSAWVVGAPLLAVAASSWRAYRDELRLALCYAVPSVAFLVMFWPIQGLGVEMDLLVAAFPAMYALAWVCAHDRRRAVAAAALLASAHLLFWRILLDGQFVNLGID